jgi:penicillin-binding protein 2
MIDSPPPPEDRRAPLTPQLALRVAIVGSVALGMFAIIFFRLWFLQVLSGSKYVLEAKTNVVRDIAVAAPRGEILDRNGVVMVDSTRALSVLISPPDLPVPVTPADIVHPPRADAVVYHRLAYVLGMGYLPRPCTLPVALKTVGGGVVTSSRLSPVGCLVAQQVDLTPYQDVTVKSGAGVSPYVQYYLAERQSRFPGVLVQPTYITGYPLGDLAAQVLGTVGPLNSAEQYEKPYRSIAPNSIIGQSGLEAQYNSYLSGTQGEEQVQVNAFGQPTGVVSRTSPTAGQNLRLSLDANLERVGQNALKESIDTNYPADGGAFVAMSPQSGAVYAMGSWPSFDPSIFTGDDLSESAYKALISPNGGQPLINRAIQSEGPDGSTFKPITAVAALESGNWLVGKTYDDTGQFQIDGETRYNSGKAAYGAVDLEQAIQVSDDIFFYNLGALTNDNPVTHPDGGPLQYWAHQFGIGRPTGIDLPDELSGTLPSPAWRAGRNLLEQECDDATGPFRYTNGRITGPRRRQGWRRSARHTPGGCGIADLAPWTIGDNINLGVGQGDVQVTPLQLAVAYSALANGGTIVRPHIGEDVESQDGTVLQRFDPPPSRHFDIDPAYLDTIRAGLRAAASTPAGTSGAVFGNFAEPVYGKTGTAQYISSTTGVETDYAWYACFVPATQTTKPITVVVWVQKGGFGAVAAAPVAREILSQWFFGKPGPYQAGTSKDQ